MGRWHPHGDRMTHDQDHDQDHGLHSGQGTATPAFGGPDRRTPTAERPAPRPPQLPYGRGQLAGRTAGHRRTVVRRR